MPSQCNVISDRMGGRVVYIYISLSKPPGEYRIFSPVALPSAPSGVRVVLGELCVT